MKKTLEEQLAQMIPYSADPFICWRSPRSAWRCIAWHLENGHEIPDEMKPYLLQTAKRMMQVPDEVETRVFRDALAKAVVPGGVKEWRKDPLYRDPTTDLRHRIVWRLHALRKERGSLRAAVEAYQQESGEYPGDSGYEHLRRVYYDSGLQALAKVPTISIPTHVRIMQRYELYPIATYTASRSLIYGVKIDPWEWR